MPTYRVKPHRRLESFGYLQVKQGWFFWVTLATGGIKAMQARAEELNERHTK